MIIHSDSNDMKERFFWCQKSYGNITRLNILRTLKKISVRFHRQAKQELKKKVAQKWCEGRACIKVPLTFFFTHIEIPMGLEGYF